MSRLREELRHERALDAESDAQVNVRFTVEEREEALFIGLAPRELPAGAATT